MSTDRGMDKEDVVHIYKGILISHKKDNIQAFKTIALQCFQIISLHSHYWSPEPTICVRFSSCLITIPALLYLPDGVTIH